jgi:WD40 repeat protein
VLRADGAIERWHEGDESGWTGSGLRDSRLRSLLQLGPRVFGMSRGGTLYELDDSLHEVTGDWSVASGARWSAMGATSDGTVLGVGDQGGQLRAWSVAGRAPIGPAVLAHAGGVAGVAVRGDGQQVVSLGANDNQLKTWTVTPAGLQPLGTFALSALGTSVAYLSDDRTIAVGEGNGSVQLLDADTLTVRSDFGANGSKSLHTAFISQVIPIRDPRTDGGFATVGLDGWIVRLTGSFGVFSSRRAAESTPLAAAINRDTGLTLIASADGTTSVVDRGVSSKFGTFVVSQATRVQMGDSATADRAVVIEDDSDTDAAVVTLRAVDASGHLGRAVARTASLPGVASAAALGGDALAVVDTSGVVRRYERGREAAVLRFDVVGSSRPSLVALRRHRLGLVVGSSVAIIDTSDGKLRKAHIVNGRDGARFSAVAAFPEGGKLAASMSDGSLVVVDVETGKQVARTMTNARSSGLAIAPDGKLMAQVDGLTGVVSIRDATTLQPVGRELAAPGFVNNLTWLDDGRRLATASTDGSVHYWDIATRKRLAELPHGSVVDNVFAAPQGSVVYSVGDGDLREWDLDPQRAVRAACAEAGRNLSRDEWETYLGSEPYRLTCPQPR